MKPRLLLWIFAASVAAQPTTGLYGRVTNALTHDPVRRAFVKIYNRQQQWDVITDGEGRFKFPPFPRAEYSFAVHRDGFTDRFYKVELSDFDDPKELAVEVFPQGVITGKVVNGFGQPLRDARIEALGSGLKQAAASVETNDLGEYRLSGLDPGSYRVRATYREGRMSELDSTPLTTASAFYGAGSPAELAVKANVTISGIDFVLNPARPATVRGTIHTESGEPIDEASLYLSDVGSGRERVSHGKFEISDVSPGSYTISARSEGPAPRFGTVSVEVRGEDVSGIDLTLYPTPKIDGLIQAPGVDGSAWKEVQVFLMPDDPAKIVLLMLHGQPDDTGAFHIGAVPGEYRLVVQVLPPGFAIDTVTFNERVVTDWKIKISPSVETQKLVIALRRENAP